MRILIDHGASVALLNHVYFFFFFVVNVVILKLFFDFQKGKTALDCAIDHKDKEMTQMLLSAPLSQVPYLSLSFSLFK